MSFIMCATMIARKHRLERSLIWMLEYYYHLDLQLIMLLDFGQYL